MTVRDGSGNIVHNLRRISWEEDAKAFDWALEFDEVVKKQILLRDYKPLWSEAITTTAGKLSVPTPDHYYPLLYILGLQDKNDPVHFFNDKAVGGSLTMTSVKLG